MSVSFVSCDTALFDLVSSWVVSTLVSTEGGVLIWLPFDMVATLVSTEKTYFDWYADKRYAAKPMLLVAYPLSFLSP